MKFDDLKNPELQEKLKNASTPEEILTIAKAQGYSLSDEELATISAGRSWKHPDCRILVTYDPENDN